jgi:predicted AAA+ superfamily ATPase
VWIEREIAKEIQEVTKIRPCVLLTGARQTGKSSLMERTFPNYRYISLDLPVLASEAKVNGGHFLERNPSPIIIDEIQYAPELFRFLKIEIDKKRNEFGRYLLMGSQKFHLMKGMFDSSSMSKTSPSSINF